MNIKDKFTKFYDWLLDYLEFNMEMIGYLDCDEDIKEELYSQYSEVKEIIEKFYDKILRQVYHIKNKDCVERFNRIIDSYYDEYFDVVINTPHDIYYYNDLLGWYRDVPYELLIFARNLNCINYGGKYYEDEDICNYEW